MESIKENAAVKIAPFKSKRSKKNKSSRNEICEKNRRINIERWQQRGGERIQCNPGLGQNTGLHLFCKLNIMFPNTDQILSKSPHTM
jgi:hypothetical protein